MALYIDEKYIGLIGHSLPRFRKQSVNIYTFRCIFCNDSHKRANKTRGYFFLYKKNYWFKCHNCNESMSLGEFLKKKFSAFYSEYQLERIRDNSPSKFVYTTNKPLIFDNTKKLQQLSISSIAELPENHIAVKYCKNRSLPTESLKHLYFTDQWTSFIKHNNWGYEFPEDNCPRLVLPWFDRQGAMLGAQLRRIDVSGKEGRYITLKDKRVGDTTKIYGFDRLNLNNPIYICEGPLDSWFVPNCVAAMGPDLVKVKSEILTNYNITYIYDNEPRNVNIVSEINKAITTKSPVVIWPSYIKEKDINDMVKAGIDVIDVIKTNTYSGLKAELQFIQWKK